MSLFERKNIRKIQRKFLWGGGYEGKRIAWVKWEVIWRTKKEGCLRVMDLKLFNIALLGK